MGKYPARCCGRWTVCCALGSVGCCDPARPWQLGVEAQRSMAEPADIDLAEVADARAGGAREPSEAVYVLLTDGHRLRTLSVDSGTGRTSSDRAVSGYTSYGGETRPWAWLRGAGPVGSFVTVEANWTVAPPPLGAPPEVWLHRVDPSTAQCERTPLPAVRGAPRGYCVSSEGTAIVVGVEDGSGAEAKVRFYRVDVRDGARVIELGALSRAASEDDPSHYAAYFYACADDAGGTAGVRTLRAARRTFGAAKLGAADVGLGTVTILPRAGHAKASWSPLRWASARAPLTLQPLRTSGVAGAHALLSLVPGKRGLELVRWGAAAPEAEELDPEVVARLGSGTGAPSLPLLGSLGYLVDDVRPSGGQVGGVRRARTRGTYAALVSERTALPLIERWAIAVVDLGHGTSTIAPLTPLRLVATTSVSGIGLASTAPMVSAS